MKKFIFKIIVFILLSFGISNYLLYLTTGQSLLSKLRKPNLPNISVGLDTLKGLQDNLPSITSQPKDSIREGVEIAYKWTDAQGVVHYSAEPPAEVQATEIIELDPNTNIVQSYKGNKEASALPETETAQPASTALAPTSGQNVLNDAKEVERLLNERFAKQRETIDSY